LYDTATLFSRIGEVRGLSALWALMVSGAQARGFGAGAYLLLDRAQPGRTVAILDFGVPRELAETYAEQGDTANDPIARIAIATGRPQLRSRVNALVSLSRDERAMMDAMEAEEPYDVLVFPLFGPHGQAAIASLMYPVEPDKELESKWAELHMLAQAAHLKALELRQRATSPPHELSQREVEILRWVAQGKSNSVIAEILALSPGTVDTYLRRVFDKLDVTDRTSAAVKGVALGLIRA
jgi:DNA-binding CsgD family transcriptional regulator